MRISINTDTHEVSTMPSTLLFKAGSWEPIEVVFTPTGGSATLLEGVTLEFAVTNAGAELVYASDFSPGAGNVYFALASFFGESLLALVNTISPSKLSAEVAWTVGGKAFRSNTISVAVYKPEIPLLGGGMVNPDPYPTAAALMAILAAKAPLDSATLTGTPRAPTAALGTNNDLLATTAFIQASLAALVLDAAKVTSGVFDVARIPVLPSQMVEVSTGDLTALTAAQQTAIARGSVVTTTDGNRWVYTGSGDKMLTANYIQLADITPDWAVIANKPAFSPAASLPFGTTSNTVAAGDDTRFSSINAAVQSALDAKASKRVYQTTSFTAVAYGRYQTSGTITVTDPSSPVPVAGDIYEVIVANGTAIIGGVTYTASRVSIVRVYIASAWVTLASVLADNLTLNGPHNTAPNQVGVTPNAADLINAAQGDARYSGKIYASFVPYPSPVIVTNSTTLTDAGVSLSLPVGYYVLEVFYSTFGANYAAQGSKAAITLVSGAVTELGSKIFRDSVNSSIISNRNATFAPKEDSGNTAFMSAPFVSVTSTAGNIMIEFKSLINVTSAAVISLRLAQYTASSAGGVGFTSGSHLIAHPVTKM